MRRAGKGRLHYGVASACADIVSFILDDRKTVIPVSVRVPGHVSCSVISLPCVVGANGVEHVVDVTPHLSGTESVLYTSSVHSVTENILKLPPFC